MGLRPIFIPISHTMTYPRPQLLALVFLLAQSAPTETNAQVAVCRSRDSLERSIEQNAENRLVELKTRIPSLEYELRYASSNNFVGKPMYPTRTRVTFLRKPAAEALQKVQQELNSQGLGLKIWDAYRPYSVTVAFWELIRDERYVANPAKGSGHNRGIAIDLTLIEIASGKEIDMGTGFDHFSDTAHHSFNQLPIPVSSNRNLLRTTMEKHGFKYYEEEWWHYSWPDPSRFEVLDIPFEKLKRMR
jgi:D-alanyl-D-alanine dipeptidase